MHITDYLAAERAFQLPLMTAYLEEMKRRYGGMSPGFAFMLTELSSYLLRGGKWIRPALALLSYQLTGGTEVRSVRKSFGGLELLHRYFLIHDDIIDRDLVRHHGPTMEQVYATYFKKTYPTGKDEMFSKGMAIVAGDVVNSLAYELLLTAPVESDSLVGLSRAYNRLTMETAAGWQLQTEQNFKPIEAVSEAEVILGMRWVSAMYSVVWPIRIRQVMAGKLNEDTWDAGLDRYGLNAGLAFQITDDVLGMFGNEAITGKPVGHDYREGKKTLLVVLAYQKANRADRQFLESTLGTDVTHQELERVRRIMDETHALTTVQTKAVWYTDQARHALAGLKPSASQKENVELLNQLAELLANRNH